MNCDDVQEQEIVEKYVTGRLSGGEAEAFEAHYFAARGAARNCRRSRPCNRSCGGARKRLTGLSRPGGSRRQRCCWLCWVQPGGRIAPGA